MANRDNYPPIDESDDALDIDLRRPPEPHHFDLPAIEGTPLDPVAMTPPVYREPDAWDPSTPRSAAIGGPFDAWAGEVLKVYDGGADAVLGKTQTADVQRIVPFWDSSKDLHLDDVPPTGSMPETNIVKAIPYPTTDHPNHHAAAGDPVIVVAGRDGRYYYIEDNEPFVGVVTQWAPRSGGSPIGTKENVAGGAGTWTISVVRQKLIGDPTAAGFDWVLSTTLESMAVTYDRVYVPVADGQHHGYRKDDVVFVFRRGQYWFALPTRESFIGVIVGAGPDGEGDFSDERYWVQEVSYTGSWSNNTWTNADSDVTEPRLVPAENLAEKIKGTHELPTDGTRYVIVYMGAEATDKQPYYAFDAVELDGMFEDPPAAPPGSPDYDDPGGLDITYSGDLTGTDYVYITGTVYTGADGKLKPWVYFDPDALFCQNATYSPQDPTGSLPKWSGISAIDATGEANNSDDFYIKGEMYQDGNNKWNPWVLIDSSDMDLWKVKVSANHTSKRYLEEAVVGDGTWTQESTINEGGDEDVKIAHIGPGAQSGSKSDYVDICGGVERLTVTLYHDDKGHVTSLTLSLAT